MQHAERIAWAAAEADPQRRLLEAASQGIEQGGFAGSWRAQQQSDAPGLQSATDIIQNAELLLVRPDDAQLLQEALHANTVEVSGCLLFACGMQRADVVAALVKDPLGHPVIMVHP